MARGFSSAPGASRELHEAQATDLDKARMLALGTSRNALVRATVAARFDCPFGLMVTLAHDYSAEVRSAVAANPRAQRSVMQYLSTDRAVPVVLALLANPALPEDLLEELAFHKKSDVRAAASARLDTGVPAVATELREDEHTPELAEHVSLVTDVEDIEFAFQESSAFLVGEPTLALEFASGDHQASALSREGSLAPASATAVAAASPLDPEPTHHHGAAHAAAFFSHTPGHAESSATRTAPVRGFRVARD